MNEEQLDIIDAIIKDLVSEDKRLEYSENEIKDRRAKVAIKLNMFSRLREELKEN